MRRRKQRLPDSVQDAIAVAQRDAYRRSTVPGADFPQTPIEAAPADYVPTAPEALRDPPAEPQSLADQLVARAEQSRDDARQAHRKNAVAASLVYIGDAVLALTERLTELDR